MAAEFGLFSDEGLIEGGFTTALDALHTMRQVYSPEDELHVAECCPDHPEHERASCEECNAEEDEPEEEDED